VLLDVCTIFLRFLAAIYKQLLLDELVEKYRDNLTNISWFMRCINEKIARLSNQEDDCRGRFWEGRFKSQALLDVKALISCMAYVDLNPIRAGIADCLEGSDFTSVQERLFALAKSYAADKDAITEQPISLAPCSATESEQQPAIIPMALTAYLELVDATGRAIRSDKPGYIPAHITPILSQLDINPLSFIHVVKNYKNLFNTAVGSMVQLRQFHQACGKKGGKWRQGERWLYGRAA